MAKGVEWSEAARADVRRIDRKTAIRILESLARFLVTSEGDVRHLQDSDPKEFRLRVGDFRIRFHVVGTRFKFCR